jgi:hypothetical protein
MSEHRDQLVRRWHETIGRLELAHGSERAALVRELQQVEAEAMRLILAEAEPNAAAVEGASDG